MAVISELLAMIGAALIGPDAGQEPPAYATNAGPRVYRPGDWPTQSDQYPLLKLDVIRDSKQSRGRSGTPQFIVSTTFRIIGEVSAPAKVNDAGATAAKAALLELQRQVEVAIVNGYPLTSFIQQISSIESQFAAEAGETHLAGVQIDITLEYPQDVDLFAPISVTMPTTAGLTLTNYPRASADIPLT